VLLKVASELLQQSTGCMALHIALRKGRWGRLVRFRAEPGSHEGAQAPVGQARRMHVSVIGCWAPSGQAEGRWRLVAWSSSCRSDFFALAPRHGHFLTANRKPNRTAPNRTEVSIFSVCGSVSSFALFSVRLWLQFYTQTKPINRTNRCTLCTIVFRLVDLCTVRCRHYFV